MTTLCTVIAILLTRKLGPREASYGPYGHTGGKDLAGAQAQAVSLRAHRGAAAVLAVRGPSSRLRKVRLCSLSDGVQMYSHCSWSMLLVTVQ